MHYARARWYDPTLGRFASEDPVDALNLYPYVGNQPMTYVDPTGQFAMGAYVGSLKNIQIISMVYGAQNFLLQQFGDPSDCPAGVAMTAHGVLTLGLGMASMGAGLLAGAVFGSIVSVGLFAFASWSFMRATSRNLRPCAE